MFLFGIVSCPRYGIAYSYGLEFSPDKHRKILSTSYFYIGGMSLLVVAFFFPFISKHWEHFAMIAVVCNIFSLFTLPFLPESPKFLHGKNRFAEARHSLNVIGRFNGVPEDDSILIFEKEFEMTSLYASSATFHSSRSKPI